MRGIDEIHKALKEQGYCHLNQKMTISEINSLAGHFGLNIQNYEVKIDPSKKNTVLNTPSAMKFHSDTPLADTIIWYALSEGHESEKLLTIALTDFQSYFSQKEIETLSKTKVSLPRGYNKAKILMAYEDYNLLTIRESGEFKVNYTHWLNIDWESPELKNKFNHYILKKEQDEVVGHYLKAHEAIILDNNKMLHSRTKLNNDSLRNHLRILIHHD